MSTIRLQIPIIILCPWASFSEILLSVMRFEKCRIFYELFQLYQEIPYQRVIENENYNFNSNYFKKVLRLFIF